MIRLARLIGTAMTAGGELGNLLRGVLAPRLHLLPGLSDQILSAETPALRRSSLVLRPRRRRGLAGQLCPNATLADGRRFDEVAGGRFAVVTRAAPTAAVRAEAERHAAVLVTAGPGDLGHWLGRATAAVVRPDGTVLRDFR